MKQEGIKVKNHRGTWYVISTHYYNGRKIYVLEHETYGDLAGWIIVDENGKELEEDKNYDLYNQYVY